MECIDAVGDRRPQIDIQYRELGFEHLLLMTLNLGEVAETQTIQAQRGFQKDRHQFPEIFVVIEEHNRGWHSSNQYKETSGLRDIR